MHLHIFTDGGSRGNPGAAACAFVVQREEQIVDQGTSSLGVMTNNEAEYHGFLLSLRWLQNALTKEMVITTITWKLDSKLVVEQLNRRWKIKEPRMMVLATECWAILTTLTTPFSIQHVVREQNVFADALLNKTLDSL